MFFYLTTTLTAILLGGLCFEGIFAFLLHYKLKNNRAYIYKFLLSNGKETLEDYVLKKFFPKYFIWLFVSLCWLMIFNGYYSILSSLLLFIRLFNYQIFYNIWETVGKNE